MNYNRILIPGDTEAPVSLTSFLGSGTPGRGFTAIVLYDEIYTYIYNTGVAMVPFVTEGIPSSTPDDDLVTVRVKAKDLRFIAQVMKNFTL